MRRTLRLSFPVAIVVASALTVACSREQATPAPAPAPAAAPSAPVGSEGSLYVTNEVGGDLSVVDVATQKVIATVALGKRPRGLAFSPDSNLLYVALSGSPIAGPGVDESTLPPPDKRADGIGVVDVTANRLLKVFPGGSDPEQVAVSQDGKRLFIANEDVSLVSVLDAETGNVVSTIKVGSEPEGVNLRPDGKVVYITSEGDNAVFAIDAMKPRLLKKIEVGPRPRSTTFLPDSSRAYVPSENAGEVRVLDTNTYKELAVIKLTGDLQRPMGGVVSPDGKFLYMTTGRGKTVAVIDTVANQHVGSIEVGARPWGIAISPDGKRIFTANGTSNDVSLVDTEARRVIAKVQVGDRPWGIAYRP
jgi:YVTN family beta-propeller protein